jgi:predicted glycogen debranching enzyme
LRIRAGSYDEGVEHEWLLANGLGGYVSSTAIGANTRAYHGLLVAAMHPPVGRMLLLSSLDEELANGENNHTDKNNRLSNHQYPGAIYPQGFRYLREFSLDPFPHFAYSVGNTKVDKTVFMVHGENTTLIHYTVSEACGAMMIVPLVTCRSFHSASKLPEISQEEIEGGTRLTSICDLFILSDEARYIKKEDVYYNLEYEAERLRGLPWRENCFSPGYFEIELDGSTSFSLMASTDRYTIPVVQRLYKIEMNRLREIENKLEPQMKRLSNAADSFVVKRGDGRSIIAGYHWFDDWGRDAMISLPGLLLVTGRHEDARSVLKTFAGSIKDGLLPNDLGAGSYNTADASLWFIQAVSSYFSCTKDKELVRQLWQKLLQIVERYCGFGPSIRMDSDSLLITGPALTWMDAQVDGKPITPRAGKACEINALWYGSLMTMERLARVTGQPWEIDLAEKVKKSYQKFWNSENGCLFDVLSPEDASIRPNQIIAAAVPELLPDLKRRSVFEVVTRELLTPYGLRTLSPRDPRYCGKYEGGPRQRDEAYHQGTVWPWLIGSYIDAFLSINGYSGESKVKAKEIIRSLLELKTTGINTIPEVFDGDAPHRPGGCISQAWSVAEVIRAWSENFLEKNRMRRINVKD